MNFGDTHIIILAAGIGARFGAPMPKQFCDLEGRPVLMHTIDNMRAAAPEASLSIVLSQAMVPFWEELCERHNFVSPPVVAGGETRFHSTAKALGKVPAQAHIIMVHDGARPFPTPDILAELRKAIVDNPACDGAIPVIKVSDSLRRVMCDGYSESVDRSAFRAVQTPQAFPANKLLEAFIHCTTPADRLTDDASVMEAFGYRNFKLTQGDSRNLKITNPEDIAIAQLFISQKR